MRIVPAPFSTRTAEAAATTTESLANRARLQQQNRVAPISGSMHLSRLRSLRSRLPVVVAAGSPALPHRPIDIGEVTRGSLACR